MHGEPLAGATARSICERAALARDPHRIRRGPGFPLRTRTSAGSRPATRCPATAPLFMGFKSGLRKNQATEDAVTITDGPFAGGTTMQVSYMRLRLDSWYGSSASESESRGCTRRRSRRSRSTTSRPTPRATPTCSARRSTATASSGTRKRRPAPAARQATDHPPRLQHRRRRPGRASLRLGPAHDRGLRHHPQRDERVAARSSRTRPSRDTVNNGINEFIFVLKRANYIIPSRADRAFPLLPNRAAAVD